MFKSDRFEPVAGDLIIAQPNDAEPSSGENQVSFTIIGRLFVGIVDGTIQLNDESELGTEKVDDKALDHHLSTEVVAPDPIASEELPCRTFCGSGFSPQATGRLNLRGPVVARTEESLPGFVSHPRRSDGMNSKLSPEKRRWSHPASPPPTGGRSGRGGSRRGTAHRTRLPSPDRGRVREGAPEATVLTLCCSMSYNHEPCPNPLVPAIFSFYVPFLPGVGLSGPGPPCPRIARAPRLPSLPDRATGRDLHHCDGE